jgi:DUF1365 family protein
VSFYYCFQGSGERAEHVLAEVTNTPWGERHSYLLSRAGEGSGPGVMSASFAKELRVSPFMGMDHVYEAHATTPRETLSVHIESRCDSERAFDATLVLHRRELTPAAVARNVARHPLPTVRVLALIYGHALGLKLAGARVHRHPGADAGRRRSQALTR